MKCREHVQSKISTAISSHRNLSKFTLSCAHAKLGLQELNVSHEGGVYLIFQRSCKQVCFQKCSFEQAALKVILWPYILRSKQTGNVDKYFSPELDFDQSLADHYWPRRAQSEMQPDPTVLNCWLQTACVSFYSITQACGGRELGCHANRRPYRNT